MEFTHGTNRRPLSHLFRKSDGVKGLRFRFVKVMKRSWSRQEIRGAFSTVTTPYILNDNFIARVYNHQVDCKDLPFIECGTEAVRQRRRVQRM